MKSKTVLRFFLIIMAGMILAGLVFFRELKTLLNRPEAYSHVLFVHILVATLFFANAIIGILWEWRSLAAGNNAAVLHTYRTVAWLDARFSSPMIISTVITGIMLTLMYGDIWQIGWLSTAFLLYLLSGFVWVASDIPTQYKVKKLMKQVDPAAGELPPELSRLLKARIWVSLAGVIPLLAVFLFMVYKPEITPPAAWFR